MSSSLLEKDLRLVPATPPPKNEAHDVERPPEDPDLRFPTWLTKTTQPLVGRDATPRKHYVPEIASTGGAKRRVEAIAWKSRAPRARWWERPDPYWETTLFDARRDWHSAKTLRGSAGSTEYPYPVVVGAANKTPPRLQIDDLSLTEHGALVALLHLCGAAGVEQLEALSGRSNTRKLLVELAGAGVVEANWFHTPGYGFPRVEMWRIKSGKAYSTFTAQMANAGLIARFFCGQNPNATLPGVSHIRHQTLAVEFLLRVLETNNAWAGWLPEAVCSPHRFLPDNHPYLPIEQEANANYESSSGRQHSNADELNNEAPTDVSVRADLCLIRPDGCKVFVEIQAQATNDGVVRKVINWSRLLDSGSFGGLVLFVIAAKPPQQQNALTQIKDVITMEASAEAQTRLLVGSWQDYSPDHCALTKDIQHLRAVWLSGANQWDETSALNHPLDSPDWGLVSKLPSLAITPDWIC